MGTTKYLGGHNKSRTSTAQLLPVTAPRGVITTPEGMQLDLASPVWQFHRRGLSIDWSKAPCSDPNLLNSIKRYVSWLSENRAVSTISIAWIGFRFLAECPSFLDADKHANGSAGTVTHEAFIELLQVCQSKSAAYSSAFTQIRGWYRWCLNRGYEGFSTSEWQIINAIKANQPEPYRTIIGPNPDETPLTPAQKRELFEALRTARQENILPIEHLVVIWLIFYRGVRPAEVKSMIESDLKRAGSHFMVSIPYVKKGTSRRNAGTRDLRIPPFLGTLIEKMICKHKGDREEAGIPEANSGRWPLFPSEEPDQGSYIDPMEGWVSAQCRLSMWIIRAGERLKLSFKLNAHRLRNTFALDLVLGGASPEELRIELGHASDKHILRYFHPGDSQVEMIDAVETERLGDVFRALATNLIDLDRPPRALDATRTRIRFGDPTRGIYVGVGQCGCKGSKCAVGLANTLNCYSCVYFCPFKQGKHELVLRQVNETIDELRLRGAQESDISVWRTYRKGVAHVIELCGAWREETKPPQSNRGKARGREAK